MGQDKLICLRDLSVGYGNSVIVENINVDFARGKMICILGSNGAGKTTMLKTISRIIPKLGGDVSIGGRELNKIRAIDLAREMSVILTSKIDIENLTGFEVASMGRYPHTGLFCRLSREDVAIVEKYLHLCSADYLGDKYFYQMSDGEKQKIMLARGLSQDADIIMLDEPTSHLDIKHKLDVLHILRRLCIQEGKTIVCTLHEPDLAIKCCDFLVLVKDDRVLISDTTEKVIESGMLDMLYGFERHQFNSGLGIIEFPSSSDKDVYIVGSDEHTAMLIRNFNKFYVGFGIGVLHRNDVIYHIASTMDAQVTSVEAYTAVTDADIEEAYRQAKEYGQILVSDSPVCPLNAKNAELAGRLRENGKTVTFINRQNVMQVLEKICNRQRK